jgi:crossover junction endodeoxyribonuclease RusA
VAMFAFDAAAEMSKMVEGPIAVGLEFVLYRPVSTPKSKTPPATKKPDIDKLERAVLDALTHVIWTDDAQVTIVLKRKRVAELGESPGVHVWVEEISDTQSGRPGQPSGKAAAG